MLMLFHIILPHCDLSGPRRPHRTGADAQPSHLPTAQHSPQWDLSIHPVPKPGHIRSNRDQCPFLLGKRKGPKENRYYDARADVEAPTDKAGPAPGLIVPTRHPLTLNH